VNFELAKEFYHRELDGKPQLDAKLSTQLLVLSFLAGLLVLVLTPGLAFAPFHQCVRTLSSAAALLGYLASVFYVLRATLGHEYATIPDAQSLSTYYAELKEFHEGNAADGVNVDEDFRTSLIPNLVEAATRNRLSNQRRSAHYYRASELFAITLVLTLVAGGARVYPDVRRSLIEPGGHSVRDKASTETGRNAPGGGATEGKADSTKEHHP
jgi:hypothetical protein